MDPARQKSLAIRKAQAEMRESWAELVYWYPQYKLEDLDEMPIGDIEMLLAFARKQYYQDKLDMLYVTTAAQSKKGFRTIKGNLTSMIKKMKARI